MSDTARRLAKEKYPHYVAPAEAVEAAWDRLHEGRDETYFDAMRAALEAALPYLRPEPSEDERAEPTDEELWDFAGDLLDAWNLEDMNPPSLIEQFRDLYVARFTRRPMPSRDEVARAIDPAIYRDINPVTGQGWAASLRAADAVLALFKGGEG